MNKIILLTLVSAGLVVTMPFKAAALDPQNSQNLVDGASSVEHQQPNVLIAQYRRDRMRQNRRDRMRQRQYYVYYRSRRERRWTLEGSHPNRRDAERASNRLERRGYLTYIQSTRRVGRYR